MISCQSGDIPCPSPIHRMTDTLRIGHRTIPWIFHSQPMNVKDISLSHIISNRETLYFHIHGIPYHDNIPWKLCVSMITSHDFHDNIINGGSPTCRNIPWTIHKDSIPHRWSSRSSSSWRCCCGSINWTGRLGGRWKKNGVNGSPMVTMLGEECYPLVN